MLTIAFVLLHLSWDSSWTHTYTQIFAFRWVAITQMVLFITLKTRQYWQILVRSNPYQLNSKSPRLQMVESPTKWYSQMVQTKTYNWGRESSYLSSSNAAKRVKSYVGIRHAIKTTSSPSSHALTNKHTTTSKQCDFTLQWPQHNWM
jgi:hypothetical protein